MLHLSPLRRRVATVLSTFSCVVGFAFLCSAENLQYPQARTVDQVDTYHGVDVTDPYRWMEESSGELASWVDAQRTLLNDYAAGTPVYERVRQRIRDIRHFDRYGTPTRRGNRYFYSFTRAGESKPTLFVQNGLEGKARAFFEVGKAIPEGERTFGGMSPSWDGKTIVWANMSQGRWGWLEIRDVDSGRKIDARIPGIAGNSATWTHDNAGFFYMHYGDETALASGAEPKARILYHEIGTPTADDRVIFEQPLRPQALYSMKLGDAGKRLVVELFDGNRNVNEVYVVDLERRGWPVRTLVDEADARYRFEGNVGDDLFFYTTLDAPKGRLLSIPAQATRRNAWQELIPERATTLGPVSHIGTHLVVRSTQDARPVVEVFDTDGKRQYQLDLPSIGLLGGFSDDPESSIAFYRFNSLIDPGTIYQADLKTGKSRLFRRPELSHNPDAYEINQVFYESKDGTRVPMFVAHKKGMALDGKSPLFMYGFGHGGWVAFPWFQPHLVAWLDMGGVYALPNLRGGGEYGKEWQDAGTRLNKQNAIDDYIAAAEYLIDKRYTSAELMVANGGSASGVVPAAAIVQRPELFGAAVIDFPFLDMFRYHKFTTIKGWTRGYGSVEDKDEFAVLAHYSPLHNLKRDVCYPAVLTIVGEADESTVPMHGYKFTAALQNQTGCANSADKPYLVMSIPGAGHYSYGLTPELQVESQAQIVAFLVRALGLDEESLAVQ